MHTYVYVCALEMYRFTDTISVTDSLVLTNIELTDTDIIKSFPPACNGIFVAWRWPEVIMC